jgi:hypothetical protein
MHPSAQFAQGPPPPFGLTSSSAVEWRSGGGCLSAVGVTVLLAGIVMALGALGVIPLKNGFDHPWTGPYLIGMSVLFLALGPTFTFGRRSLIIDPFTGSLIAWKLSVPLNGPRSLAPLGRTCRGLLPR